MEIAQGNALWSYLKQKKTPFFYFTKSDNKRVEQVVSGVFVPVRGCGRVNTVWILCTHVCKLFQHLLKQF
jgi:hypothetical protein